MASDIRNRQCTACQADVIYVKSAVSRALCILNAEPDPQGNIVIRDGEAHVLKRAELFGEGAEATTDEPRYLSHFATCPQASKFRKSAK